MAVVAAIRRAFGHSIQMAGFAAHAEMGSLQWEFPGLVEGAAYDLPLIHCVALAAIHSQLALVWVVVALDACMIHRMISNALNGRQRIVKGVHLVTFGAFDAGVSAQQRKRASRMVERRRFERLGCMARHAVLLELPTMFIHMAAFAGCGEWLVSYGLALAQGERAFFHLVAFLTRRLRVLSRERERGSGVIEMDTVRLMALLAVLAQLPHVRFGMTRVAGDLQGLVNNRSRFRIQLMAVCAGHLRMRCIQRESCFGMIVRWKLERLYAVAFLALVAELALVNVFMAGDAISGDWFVAYGLAATRGESALFLFVTIDAGDRVAGFELERAMIEFCGFESVHVVARVASLIRELPQMRIFVAICASRKRCFQFPLVAGMAFLAGDCSVFAEQRKGFVSHGWLLPCFRCCMAGHAVGSQRGFVRICMAGIAVGKRQALVHLFCVTLHAVDFYVGAGQWIRCFGMVIGDLFHRPINGVAARAIREPAEMRIFVTGSAV